jgi:hypothetical protein
MNRSLRDFVCRTNFSFRIWVVSGGLHYGDYDSGAECLEYKGVFAQPGITV